MTFQSFDPLAAKATLASEAAINAVKREIRNILDSYIGWYDPFAELIQNSLDAIDERFEADKKGGKLFITVDLRTQTLSVVDNGIALDEEKFRQFLAPSFSFKSSKARGHKGVGATYLAYGFNYMKIATKHPQYAVTGVIRDARKWLAAENPASNPRMEPEATANDIPHFVDVDRGVGITLRFDANTKPADLRWIQVSNAAGWMQLLRAKTGLGAIAYDNDTLVTLDVIDSAGKLTSTTLTRPSYLWPHELVSRAVNTPALVQKEAELFAKNGAGFAMPSTFRNIEALYEFADATDLVKSLGLDDDEVKTFDYSKIKVYYSYFYTTKVFSTIDESIGIRKGQKLIAPGIQIAANNMPQGEIIQIPLRRYAGRQNQMHVVFHAENARADLGRKGFQKELITFCETVAEAIIQKHLNKYAKYMKANSGAPTPLLRQQLVDEWKKEFEEHQKTHPLVLKNEHFFKPKLRASVLSEPTREQDVIALFNQFLAGGVIRGVEILSTNERFAYDSMFRIVMGSESERDVYIYDETTNPLGIDADRFHADFVSAPRILEYKLNFDALIEDVESSDKSLSEIDLAVVWEIGSDFERGFGIMSLLDPGNTPDREYHGITHRLINSSTGQHEVEIVCLSELIAYMNDPVGQTKYQRDRYE